MKNRIPSVFGLAHIMREAFAGSDLSDLTQRLVQRISQDSRDSAALLDLCVVKQLQGQPAAALQLQWEALQQHQHYRLSTNAARPALRVLAVMGPGEVMANTPIEFLLEKSDIALELLFVGACRRCMISRRMMWLSWPSANPMLIKSCCNNCIPS
jgi:hypothetical protein